MRLFDRDPRAETQEILDAIKPEPEKPKQLTVAELILLLQHEDQELGVKVEGCDCDSDAIGVEIRDGYLMVYRESGCWENERRLGE